MRKIGVLSIIIITAGFIFYLYQTNKLQRDKIIQAETAIRTNMEKSFLNFNQKVKQMEKELKERIDLQKSELDPKLAEYDYYLAFAVKEDYSEIRDEIARLTDAFRSFDEKIKQFKRSSPVEKSTKDTEDLFNMILLTMEKQRDYYSCLEKSNISRESLNARMEKAQDDLKRRRKLNIPEKEEYEPCKDDLTTLNKVRDDLLEHWRQLKRKPIAF